MKSRLLVVGIASILSKWLGESERNLADIFQTARRHAPCVVFLDELDALGHKRSQLGHASHNVVNQLLEELDGAARSNEGVYVLGATNHPWDIDGALLRPGRFDRVLLVVPPDLEARRDILSRCCRDRPVSGVDLVDLAKRSDGLSGEELRPVRQSGRTLR